MNAHTIDTWLRDRTRTTPNRVAIDFGGAETTYAQLDAESARLAFGLICLTTLNSVRNFSRIWVKPISLKHFTNNAPDGLRWD